MFDPVSKFVQRVDKAWLGHVEQSNSGLLSRDRHLFRDPAERCRPGLAVLEVERQLSQTALAKASHL